VHGITLKLQVQVLDGANIFRIVTDNTFFFSKKQRVDDISSFPLIKELKKG
jgi:hypothetical protein